MKKPLAALLAVLAILVTGCPHNEYVVDLTPRGAGVERKLTFYRTDTNPGSSQDFPEAELIAINSLYPKNGIANEGSQHIARGEFTDALPDDVGGAGTYTNFSNSMGSAGFYAERFRGTNDLAGIIERRFRAADRLANLAIGWSKAELGNERGYDQLRSFLDGGFRQDLKNLSVYWHDGVIANGSNTNGYEEHAVRFAQYVMEHGYLKPNDLPAIFRRSLENDNQMMAPLIQRLAAAKMGIDASLPLPKSFGFLADDEVMKKSFEKYLATTDEYREKLTQWEKDRRLAPGLNKPNPADVENVAVEALLDFDLNFFGDDHDRLTVRLSLPSPPEHSNGTWDATRKQVVWESPLNARTNLTGVPMFCYANWAVPDETFQQSHFGKILLKGEELVNYCLFCGALNRGEAAEWNTFLDGFQPDDDLAAKFEPFHFSDETKPYSTNGPATPLSDYLRVLFKAQNQ